MSKHLNKTIETFSGFIVLGVVIALLFGLFFFLINVIIWGFVIGSFLFVVSWVKNFFFPKVEKEGRKGRVIEHDDQ